MVPAHVRQRNAIAGSKIVLSRNAEPQEKLARIPDWNQGLDPLRDSIVRQDLIDGKARDHVATSLDCSIEYERSNLVE